MTGRHGPALMVGKTIFLRKIAPARFCQINMAEA